MTLRPQISRVLLLTLAVCLLGGAAEAGQSGAANAARGLFGGRSGPATEGQALDLTLSAVAASSNDLDAGGEHNLGQVAGSEWHGAGALTGRYRFESRRLAASVGGATMWRRYFDAGAPTAGRHAAEASLTLTPWSGTVLRMDGIFSRLPFYQVVPIPGALPESALDPSQLDGDFATSATPTMTYGATVDATQRLPGRMSLSARYDARRTQVGKSQARHLETVHWMGELRFHVARHLTVRLGYGARYNRVRDEPVPATHAQDVVLGVDFSKPLSLSRRTSLGLSTGSAMYEGENGARQYDVLGSVWLNREFLRTWNARIGFDRRLELLDGIETPLVSDAIVATGGGFLARRVNVSASGGVARGLLRQSRDGNEFQGFTQSFRIGVAVSQHVTITADQAWYDYRLDQAVFGLPTPRTEGLRGRVGVTVWLPVLR